MRDPDRDDVHHQAQPDPRLRELPQLVAVQHEQDAEDRDGVDELLRDVRHEVVRLRHGPAAMPGALLCLRRVEPVEHDRTEADDGGEDVQHEQRLVETRSVVGKHREMLAHAPPRDAS